jgi:hypothetical protein
LIFFIAMTSFSSKLSSRIDATWRMRDSSRDAARRSASLAGGGAAGAAGALSSNISQLVEVNGVLHGAAGQFLKMGAQLAEEKKARDGDASFGRR